jgi:hypothetical protein
MPSKPKIVTDKTNQREFIKIYSFLSAKAIPAEINSKKTDMPDMYNGIRKYLPSSSISILFFNNDFDRLAIVIPKIILTITKP